MQRASAALVRIVERGCVVGHGIAECVGHHHTSPRFVRFTAGTLHAAMRGLLSARSAASYLASQIVSKAARDRLWPLSPRLRPRECSFVRAPLPSFTNEQEDDIIAAIQRGEPPLSPPRKRGNLSVCELHGFVQLVGVGSKIDVKMSLLTARARIAG